MQFFGNSASLSELKLHALNFKFSPISFFSLGPLLLCLNFFLIINAARRECKANDERHDGFKFPTSILCEISLSCAENKNASERSH